MCSYGSIGGGACGGWSAAYSPLPTNGSVHTIDKVGLLPLLERFDEAVELDEHYLQIETVRPEARLEYGLIEPDVGGLVSRSNRRRCAQPGPRD